MPMSTGVITTTTSSTGSWHFEFTKPTTSAVTGDDTDDVGSMGNMESSMGNMNMQTGSCNISVRNYSLWKPLKLSSLTMMRISRCSGTGTQSILASSQSRGK